ncbi:hypothetical protein [Bradyrhizobium sp. ARR65]|uniref:hypothetical protein n=1 Tax=Bradyrhizobium sp. ARR65 TaxID=1040989 RepID=UPI00046729E5|nr:hypothetical protein [Bradyrhizobium sp. ARR65]
MVGGLTPIGVLLAMMRLPAAMELHAIASNRSAVHNFANRLIAVVVSCYILYLYGGWRLLLPRLASS